MSQDTNANTEKRSLPEQVDLRVRAAIGRMFSSISPNSSFLAWIDWMLHLAVSPGKKAELIREAWLDWGQLAQYAQQAAKGNGEDTQLLKDRRFAAPEWQKWPFNVMQQAFLLNQRWREKATQGVHGVDKHHEKVIAFAARQWLDTLSPTNNLFTNPVVLRRTMEEGGMNLVRGMMNAMAEFDRALTGKAPAGTEKFVVGKDVAVTPGKVIFKNRLIELIQYSPTTEKVRPEPVLIIPAWIMKYYILDLSPHNSLVRYLVGQGHTVFCISWKNPGVAERDLGMDDYLNLGIFDSLKAINAVVPGKKIHAAGYCIGGTLLAMATAAMARDNDDRLATTTLFTAQTDFTEPGELALFIDESQVSMLEAAMDEKGFLTSSQMAGAFQLLRSYDLLWSRMVSQYLLGESPSMNDLMAWNADATRMPARMHSEYLRKLFLNDDLSEGRFQVGGRPISLGDITLPVFNVGTRTDHVAPWKSVYKLHYLSPAEITFVLTSGGHNAGIVSEPGHPRRSYQMQTRAKGGLYRSPDEWIAEVPVTQGSWWPAWDKWLNDHSGAPVSPPKMGAAAKGYTPLYDAPGEYVMEK